MSLSSVKAGVITVKDGKSDFAIAQGIFVVSIVKKSKTNNNKFDVLKWLYY